MIIDDLTYNIDFAHRVWHMDFNSFRKYYHSLSGDWIEQDECMYLKAFVIGGRVRKLSRMCDIAIDSYIDLQKERGAYDEKKA